jgi:hypothetical protein
LFEFVAPVCEALAVCITLCTSLRQFDNIHIHLAGVAKYDKGKKSQRM